MKPTVAILTVGKVSVSEVLPFLTEHISEQQISQVSLLGNLSSEEVRLQFSPSPGEDTLLTLLADNTITSVGRNKISIAMQGIIEQLDNQGYEVILLMSTMPLTGLSARNAILLEPERIIPPLVASIVDGHQVGIILPVAEMIKFQELKWHKLTHPPRYALANPIHGSENELLEAGKKLMAEGADVLVLDCLGYHQKHRDLLQKQLDVPVLLSNVLVARLAAELLI
ncbi:AroM family protein [Cedecea neteri]|uniref:AroM family protein n=1 Tax=Cedecea neteri TaxID=158822 RepID=UPI0004F59356|nr:AroM family protein [Cedecea neteri]AIR65421.1 AroM protein [Cedecea neteri]